MKFIKVFVSLMLVFILFSSVTGCATYKTINNAQINSPKFFSGTRLDLNAINNNKVALLKFKVQPPEYPLLDLPGSVLLDLIVSPLTAGMVLYEIIVY